MPRRSAAAAQAASRGLPAAGRVFAARLSRHPGETAPGKLLGEQSSRIHRRSFGESAPGLARLELREEVNGLALNALRLEAAGAAMDYQPYRTARQIDLRHRRVVAAQHGVGNLISRVDKRKHG